MSMKISKNKRLIDDELNQIEKMSLKMGVSVGSSRSSKAELISILKKKHNPGSTKESKKGSKVGKSEKKAQSVSSNQGKRAAS